MSRPPMWASPSVDMDFNDIVAYLEYGHVECTATKVVHNNLLVFLLVKTVSQSAAAVGSLIMRFTSRPAIRPASWVALR
jgi:hypothetical protein